MEEEILISGWHSCTVLMVLMVKERRTLVEGRDIEQWSIGGIASVVGGKEEALVFRRAMLLSESSRWREGRPGPFRWHVGDEGRQRRGGNESTLFTAYTNGCQRSIIIMFDISIQL